MTFVNIVSIYFLIMVVSAVYSAAHIRSLNSSRYTQVLVLLCFAICFYIFGYTMELNATNLFQLLFWNRFEYIGIPFVSALWLLSGLMYTNHFSRWRKILLAAIFLIPLISLVLRFTNDFHHLYFSSVTFLTESGTLRLVKNPGPWMYVQSAHSMLMIFITLGLFIQDSVKAGDTNRGKIGLLTAASLIAVAGLILSLVKPFGVHIDYMALCLPATCELMVLAISQYEFLETKFIARSKVFEVSKDAIFLVNRQDRIIDYNSSAKRILEHLHADLSRQPFSSLFQPSSGFPESQPNTAAFITRLNLGNQEKYYEVSTRDIDEKNIVYGWIKTVRDVTEIYKLNENLQKQAMMDELSELSNRRAFMQLGQKLVAGSDETGTSIHLLMMDLDLFKRVNDQYGHPMGDQVIQTFGQILKRIFHESSLVARLGGEEFAVLLAGFSDEEMAELANAVLKNTEQHEFLFQGEIFHITVSIGVAKKGHGTENLNSLMRIADKALYQSKDRGRNCVTIL